MLEKIVPSSEFLIVVETHDYGSWMDKDEDGIVTRLDIVGIKGSIQNFVLAPLLICKQKMVARKSFCFDNPLRNLKSCCFVRMVSHENFFKYF